MKTVKKKIEELTINPNNTRVHGQVQIKEFIRSIEQFGVIRPIVADENGVILCGNGLYEALVQMGYKEVDVLVKSGLTENQKKKILLADNKIFSLGVDDYDAIDKLLQELNGDFDIAGYNAEDLENIYGQSSLEEAKDVTFETPKIEPKNIQIKQSNKEYGYEEKSVETPNNGFMMEDNKEQEQERYIICPHCGEKIKL
jgi:hypothetical protein